MAPSASSVECLDGCKPSHACVLSRPRTYGYVASLRPWPARLPDAWVSGQVGWGVVAGGRVGVGFDRSAGVRGYLGARRCGRRRDGGWVVPGGATPAARCFGDGRPWAAVASSAGAGRKLSRNRGVGARMCDRERLHGSVDEWFQRGGAELLQGVEAAAGEFACDRERGAGVGEAACAQFEVRGVVGAACAAG